MAIRFNFENIPPVPVPPSLGLLESYTEGFTPGLDSEESRSRSSSLDPYAFPLENTLSRKRRASSPASEEELGQTVADFLRHHKMAKTTQAEFTAAANMSHAERELRILGHLMVIEDHLAGKFVSEGDGGELQVTIGGSTSSTGKIPSDDMKAFIDKETFLVLVKPDLARYIDKDADKTGTSESILETGPKDIIWSTLMDTPNIGYKPSMNQHGATRRTIKTYIGTKLNQRRYCIKQKIEESFGSRLTPSFIVVPASGSQDIIQLTQNILNILKSARVPLTYGRVCRVAFLRNAYRMAHDEKMSDYWAIVDQELHQGRKHTKSEQKRYFHMLFLKDMENYGKPNELKLMELLKTCTADDREHGCDVLD